MKVHLEADSSEILEKGPDLIRKLAARLGVDLVQLVDSVDLVQKSMPKEPELRHKALRGMHEKERKIYDEQMRLMLEEIGVTLNKTLQKGDDPVRAKLLAKGFKDQDFDNPRGVLHGMSIDELQKLAE